MRYPISFNGTPLKFIGKEVSKVEQVKDLGFVCRYNGPSACNFTAFIRSPYENYGFSGSTTNFTDSKVFVSNCEDSTDFRESNSTYYTDWQRGLYNYGQNQPVYYSFCSGSVQPGQLIGVDNLQYMGVTDSSGSIIWYPTEFEFVGIGFDFSNMSQTERNLSNVDILKYKQVTRYGIENNLNGMLNWPLDIWYTSAEDWWNKASNKVSPMLLKVKPEYINVQDAIYGRSTFYQQPLYNVTAKNSTFLSGGQVQSYNGCSISSLFRNDDYGTLTTSWIGTFTSYANTPVINSNLNMSNVFVGNYGKYWSEVNTAQFINSNVVSYNQFIANSANLFDSKIVMRNTYYTGIIQNGYYDEVYPFKMYDSEVTNVTGMGFATEIDLSGNTWNNSQVNMYSISSGTKSTVMSGGQIVSAYTGNYECSSYTNDTTYNIYTGNYICPTTTATDRYGNIQYWVLIGYVKFDDGNQLDL